MAKDLLTFHEYHYRGIIDPRNEQETEDGVLRTHLNALLYCKMPACEAHRIADGLTDFPARWFKVGFSRSLVKLALEVIENLKSRVDETKTPAGQEHEAQCFTMIGG